MQDKLVDIPIKDLSILRDLYKVEWPKNHMGYYAINNYIEWFKQDPNVPHIKIYSLNDDWSDGTYIITDRSMLFMNTLSGNLHRLTTALTLIDFSKGFIIANFYERFKDTVLDFVSTQGFQYNLLVPTKWYFLSRADGRKLIIHPPAGITLRHLSLEHAAIANELWPFRSPGSVRFLERLTKYNVSFGAFTSEDELVAWCFRLPSGGLGALQVMESYKRKGIGTVLVKAMAKAISDMNQDVCAPVVVDNYPSQNMFEKVGFKAVDEVQWLSATSYKFSDWMD